MVLLVFEDVWFSLGRLSGDSVCLNQSIVLEFDNKANKLILT